MKNAQTFLIPEFGFEIDIAKTAKPGLMKPERTYRGEVAYVGRERPDIERQTVKIGSHVVELLASSDDEMAVLNKSRFFVCESCGYAEREDNNFRAFITKEHKTHTGRPCQNESLKHYSLGYRFKTDVLQIRFLTDSLMEINPALSVVYGLLRGACSYLNIDEQEINVCLRWNQDCGYAAIFYDQTPGGAGHVKRLNYPEVIMTVFKRTLELMESCSCGSDEGDSSCYGCLRSYYNQRHHDDLQRKYVIDFLRRFVSKG